ncbi:Cytochrome c551/c552 [Arcticibacter svalbardensis MN12-7]|uniref:Cytochrome c551/c552 n=1 Tax=Arcticibacter svalbardensis MN12-7 TaxID=1150600 RepID=R9GUH5_9SPHI|nr:ThuA domain-containing protein [Arcticibacter svalbardensis]EOR95512.1 Cytochrome c551/c552 [Arcticibacter svalbardensis MN12-7]
MINKTINLRGTLFLLFLFFSVTSMAQRKARLLVFCKTAGYHHSSIEVGKLAILKLGKENGFDVDTTSKADLFTKKGLKKYQAVVFLSTTGDVLNEEQQSAFQHYIQAGNGFAGVHAATDTEYDWPWFGDLVGAYFAKHPEQQTAVLNVVDKNSIATSHLPDQWQRKDEWYNFKWMTKDPLHVLITIDEHSYDAGPAKMGDYHPMSWYHDFDGGRSFYTALGHTEASYSDPLFLKHLLGGLQYALGTKKMK